MFIEELEICPELKEYLNWLNEEAKPQFQKLAEHLVICEKCRLKFLELKDQLGYEMLKTSEIEFIEILKEGKIW